MEYYRNMKHAVFTQFVPHPPHCSTIRRVLRLFLTRGKLSIGGPSQFKLKTKKKIKKRSSPPQIVEFECILDQNIV